MSAPTLTEFLLARIAEDEASARESAEMPWRMILGAQPSQVRVLPTARCHDPARVLAHCKANRQIVERAADEDALYSYARDAIDPHDPDDWARGARWGLEYALRALATVYADHPDFREEWGR